MAQWLMNLTRNNEVVGSIPGLLIGSGIQCCPELQCRSRMQLRSHVAVALARLVATAPIRPGNFHMLQEQV